MSAPASLLEFGPFRLDPARRLLWKDEELVPLTPKAIELLAALVERPGQVVAKQELLDRVWPDTFVEEANLSVNVSSLRKALGRRQGGEHYIQTVSRRGYRFVSPVRPARPAPRSLAVLPFTPLDAADELLGVGMADALITRLGPIGQILVRPTSAVLQYAGRYAQDAGRELHVDAVLDGRIQRAGDRVRVTVQLVSVAEGATIWADTLDEPFTHIFAVQDALSERLSHALTLHLSAADRERLTRRPTGSIEAYEAYLRGRYFWNRLTGAWLQKAREAFEEAIGRDPAFALAHAGLADTYTMLGLFGLLPPDRAWPRARAAAEKAIEIDGLIAEAHVSLAYCRLFGEWAWSDAERELLRAMELNPASAAVRQWRALYLAMIGRFEDAMAEVRRAQELDPLSLTVSTNMGFQLYLTQQYEGEIEQHRRTLELDPDYAVGHWALGLAYEQRRMHGEAIEEYRKAVDLSGDSALMKSNLARGYALAGRVDEARGVLGEMTEPGPGAAASAYRIATVHAALGEADRTIEWLRKALAQRDHWMVWLKVDPMLEPVRSHPAFAALLEGVGFPR